MKASKIIKDHLITLEHFIEQGGYPLKLSSYKDKDGIKSYNVMSHDLAVTVCKLVPGLCIDKGFLKLDPSSAFDQEILTEYWKYRFKEEKKEADRLHSLIEKFKEMVG
jgi:hypothetical protein